MLTFENDRVWPMGELVGNMKAYLKENFDEELLLRGLACTSLEEFLWKTMTAPFPLAVLRAAIEKPCRKRRGIAETKALRVIDATLLYIQLTHKLDRRRLITRSTIHQCLLRHSPGPSLHTLEGIEWILALRTPIS